MKSLWEFLSEVYSIWPDFWLFIFIISAFFAGFYLDARELLK
jgi:hypothetical protein